MALHRHIAVKIKKNSVKKFAKLVLVWDTITFPGVCQMINPAFIVDGLMEKRIIQKVCPGKPVRLLNCNGKAVSYEAAAKRVASLVRLLKNNYPIVIIFDREERSDTSLQITTFLKEAILSQGIQQVDLLLVHQIE